MKKVVYPILLMVLLLGTGCYEIGRKARVEEEVLKAFESLSNSLEDTGANQRGLNHERRDAIRERIEDQIAGGNSKHKWMLEDLDVIQEQTASLTKYIHSIEKDLREGAGYIAETGEIIDKRDVEESGKLMMGRDPSANQGSGNGKAYELRRKLEDFEGKCNQRMKQFQEGVHPDQVELIEPLVVQPKDDPYIAEFEPDRALLTWEEDTFEDKPVVADLAILTKLRMEVAGAEATQLALMGGILGDITCNWDSLVAIGAPINEVVAAGMKFETKLFVAKSGVPADSNNYRAVIINGGDTIEVQGEFTTRVPEVRKE